jgi:hypothetical protein
MANGNQATRDVGAEYWTRVPCIEKELFTVFYDLGLIFDGLMTMSQMVLIS